MILSKDNIDIGLIAASGQVFRIRDEKDGQFTAIHRSTYFTFQTLEMNTNLAAMRLSLKRSGETTLIWIRIMKS